MATTASGRKKAAAVATATVCCASLAAYEAHRRGWFQKTSRALKNVVETASDTAESLRTLARDAREFLSSDSEVVPQSIRQAIKLASCEETQEAVQANVQATLKGVLNQTRDPNAAAEDSSSPSSSASTSGRSAEEDAVDAPPGALKKRKASTTSTMLATTLEKVFSKKGSGFFSIIAASVARQTIQTLMENASEQTSDGEAFEKYRDLLLSEEGKQFISDLLVTLVVESTAVYMDKTVHINYYDQILESAIKPQHKSFVENLCVKLCRVWTETVMAPAPPAQALADDGRHHGGGDLCTPRDYPALVSNPPSTCPMTRENGANGSDCGSPNSVVGGFKQSLSSTPDRAQAARQGVGGTRQGAGGTNSDLVKDILSSAAGDEKVRSFLVSVASSSTAAATGVVLEAFIPSWLMTNKGRVPGGTVRREVARLNGAHGKGEGVEVARSEASQQALVCAFALLFLVVAFWMYR